MDYLIRRLPNWTYRVHPKGLRFRGDRRLQLGLWIFSCVTFLNEIWVKCRAYIEAYQRHPKIFRHCHRKIWFRNKIVTRLSFFGTEVFEQNLAKSKIQKMIKDIDHQFDLVLIMEYFDLGLALLSIELCWPLKYLGLDFEKLSEFRKNFEIGLFFKNLKNSIFKN